MMIDGCVSVPALSVLLPTYNGERFLREQLDSILGQSDPDFELLVIDDGSTDATVGIIDDYVRRDDRVRRLASTGNKGQNRRIVELLAQARGEFVAIADQDDVWHKDRNAVLMDAIGDKALACGRSQLIDADGKDLGTTLLNSIDVDPIKVGPLTALFCPLVSAHASVFAKKAIDYGVFYSALPFDLALGLDAQFSTGLVYSDDAIVMHRIHGGNQLNGSVLKVKRKFKPLSPYVVKTSLNQRNWERLALYQRLDYLSRSWGISARNRTSFRHLAGSCWNAWYGLRIPQKALREDFHRYLDEFASSSSDLAFFTSRISGLSRSRIARINLELSWHLYRGG